MSAPLDLDALDSKAREFYRLGLTHGGMADDVLHLTAEVRRLREAGERVRAAWKSAREVCISDACTTERDNAPICKRIGRLDASVEALGGSK